MHKRILKLRETARAMNMIFGDDDMYEVLVDNKDRHIVDLRRKKYDYKD